MAHSHRKECPTCGQTETLVSCGPGVERIHEEASQLFPTAKLCMVTSDTLNNPKEFLNVDIADISSNVNNNTDIIFNMMPDKFSAMRLINVPDAQKDCFGY